MNVGTYTQFRATHSMIQLTEKYGQMFDVFNQNLQRFSVNAFDYVRCRNEQLQDPS